ncbi:hypothetical protein DVB69_07035 [Sporosarcina sp. BI001-red]|uniref:hypothetical protein n=1 Tax=Sporosarcina sp. BI001-red TaxID=2282866 RepID=UPI000E234FA1|nr:hypothetical protein [Sporosarcina sp. BI001-red]REB08867.1 hypothetical protein DVB69_07035 [Sporosarcina sp. BI001-red]
MIDRIPDELEITKQQLALCKQQDCLLEKIEMKLHAMKKIAQYAAEHELTLEERTRQNKELEEHQSIIRGLEQEYGELLKQRRNDFPLQ